MALGIGNHVSATAASAAAVTTSGIVITAGSLVVVGVFNFTSSGSYEDATTTITDSTSDTFTRVGRSVIASSRYAGLYYAKNVAGGASVTFTYNLSTSDFPRIYVLEVTGADTSTPLDQGSDSTFATSSSAASKTSPQITTDTADEILVAIGYDVHQGDANSWTNGGSSSATWTRDENITDSSTLEGSLAHAIVAATGTYSATYNITPVTDTLNCGIASFRIQGAGGGGFDPSTVPWAVQMSEFNQTALVEF